MTRVQIERKRGLAPAVFARDHLQGAGRPVIVTDATERWIARAKWTFDFLRTTYGSDFVWPTLGLYSGVVKATTLSAYIDYLDSPAKELRGFWVDVKDGQPLRTPPASGSRAYLVDWHAFKRHPELFDDIKPAPYFVSDWVLALSPTLRDVFQRTTKRDYWELIVGPEGSLTQLHLDFGSTCAYLAQIQGRKRAILFSPEDSAFLYGGGVDPEQPDLERFELFDQATAFEAVLEAGDVLFIPVGWWHCVRGLEKSITVSHNFFNDLNFADHLAHLLRHLPTLAEGLDKVPGWREELRVKWRSKGFEAPGV